MKFVLHRGTGTLVAVDECDLVDDQDWTEEVIDEINDGGEIPDYIWGVSLAKVLTKLQ